jgi:hypothetical protein
MRNPRLRTCQGQFDEIVLMLDHQFLDAAKILGEHS